MQAVGVHHRRMSYRVYIDESGDHTYNRLDDPSRRYLGLTGVIFHKAEYDPAIPQAMEALKRQHLFYDIDNPPILIRNQIMAKRSFFSVLADAELRRKWDDDVIAFLSRCPMQVFTMVFDKQAYSDGGRPNPYSDCLTALLERIYDWLSERGNAQADIMAESRGDVEDRTQVQTYLTLRDQGTSSTKPEDLRRAFPSEVLLFRRKEHNVAGLQIADLLAAEQKALTVQEHNLPMPRQIRSFGQRANAAIAGKINDKGRVVI